jgi:hypothetical protein
MAGGSVLTDPNTRPGGESGADVLAMVDGRRVGIQVTEVDLGRVPGTTRGKEKRVARAAGDGAPYFAWGQNEPAQMIDAVARAVQAKALRTPAGFDEAWLLICAGVPEIGAVASTMLFTRWIAPEALTTATASLLASAAYSNAFIMPILGAEAALYTWAKGSGVRTVQRGEPFSPCFEEVQSWLSDPELLRDPEGWADREALRVLDEIRKAGTH